jgi:lysophospholipase L1-like esterase
MRGPRRLLAVAGVGLAVLVVAEAGVRLLEPALPEPATWPDDATALKVAQMDDLDCADVVFVGNSVARDDLSPERFGEQTGLVAYNAALDAASARQVARWVPDQVVPRLDPDAVVWVVTSPDLSDGAPAGQAAFESYADSPGGRDDLLGRLQRPLVDHVALVRNRAALTDPAVLQQALGDRLGGDDAPRIADDGLPGLIGPAGQGVSRQELTYVPDDPVVTTFVRDQLLDGFAIGDGQLDAAGAVVAGLRDRGIEVVLVMPPVTDEFVELHPGGRTAFDEYRLAMADLADAHDVAVLDYADEGAPSWFADTHHLNGDGASRLTTMLADDLAGLGALPASTRCGGGAA